MIKLYGFELSFPVNRVRLCLNAMALDYEFIRVNPLTREHRTEAFLKLSIAGKMPVIDDDGFALFESNAIMKYVCRKYKSDFYPSDLIAQANVDKWLDFTAIHVGNGIGKVFFNKIIAGIVGADVDEQSMKDGYGFTKRFVGVIDKQLGTSTFLASDRMTIADFCLLATVDLAEVIDIDIGKYPHVNAWRNQLMQQPFYTKVHSSYGETLEKFKAEMAQKPKS